MRTLLFLFPFLIVGCIGTDEVDFPLGQERSSLEISQPSVALQIGNTAQLEAVYTNFEGTEASTDLTWSSDNETIATVSTTGLVTAIATGQTMIRVSEPDGLTASVLVTVVADVNAISEITISSPTQTLDIGQSTQLSISVKNILGEELTGPFQPVWSSSNPGIISVNDQGLATAVAAGPSEITATVDGIISLPYSLTVSGGERTGTFQGVNGYNVSGSVAVDDNTVELGSNFSASNGPGLYIYLTTSSSSVSGGIELGALVSTAGVQSYNIPQGEDVNNYQYVIVYCKPFGIPFGFAELQ